MKIDQAKTDYPVVIIGGGMVGASFALALQQRLGLDSAQRILVIEAVAPVTQTSLQPSFDSRSTALSYGTRKIFSGMGLWTALKDCAEAIRRIHVSDAGHFGSTQMDCTELGVEALGYVLENRQLGMVLQQALIGSALIEFLSPATVETVCPVAEGMSLQLRHGDKLQTLTASLVVLVDGGRSPVCQQLGITTNTESYGQQAMVSTIAFEKPHDNTAFERFTETGPLAVLPLGNLDGLHRGALVWTVANDDIVALQALTDTELLDRLQQRFGYRLGRITRIGKRQSYPLSLAVAREQVRPGLALLGNVAHSLHPVAGQGFNLSLRDAEALADQVAAALAAGASPGAMSVLQKFVDLQRRDQNRTIDFSHQLIRWFSSNKRSRIWLRKTGLAAVDLLPVLKREFARQAMGLADR